MSTTERQSAFFDFFRRILAWKNASGYLIPLQNRKKLPPNGQVHSATAVQARILS